MHPLGISDLEIGGALILTWNLTTCLRAFEADRHHQMPPPFVNLADIPAHFTAFWIPVLVRMTKESAETLLCRGFGGAPHFLFFYPQDRRSASGGVGAQGVDQRSTEIPVVSIAW